MSASSSRSDLREYSSYNTVKPLDPESANLEARRSSSSLSDVHGNYNSENGSSNMGNDNSSDYSNPYRPTNKNMNMNTNYHQNYYHGCKSEDSDWSTTKMSQLLNSSIGKLDTRVLVYSLIYIALWYLFSISISVYNKWMFSSGHLNFAFPLFTTAGHQIVQFALAFLVSKYINGIKRPLTTTINNNGGFTAYCRKVGPCAFAATSDIGLGNRAMRQVRLSFYTMVKSSALSFVLLFGILFGLEKPNKSLASIVGTMTLGVMMMVAGETDFSFPGFVLVMSSASFNGLRWCLTQVLLSPESQASDNNNRKDKLPLTNADFKPSSSYKGKSQKRKRHSPLEIILLSSPMTAAGAFLLACCIEGLPQVLSADLWYTHGIFRGLMLIAFPGLLAFCMTVSEYALLTHVSVLTLSIAGIVKEILTVCSAYLFFGDELSSLNVFGLFITIVAIVMYNAYRYKGLQSLN